MHVTPFWEIGAIAGYEIAGVAPSAPNKRPLVGAKMGANAQGAHTQAVRTV